MNVKPNPMSARDFLLFLDNYFSHKAGDEITQGDLDLIASYLKPAKDLLNAMEENLASTGFTAPPPASAPRRTGKLGMSTECDEDCPFCY